MADSWEAIDINNRGSLTAVSSVDNKTIVRLVADPITGRLLTQSSSGGGLGTWYKVTGTIDGNNKTFSIATVAGSDFLLVLARQPQAQTVGADTWDYSYITGGGATTITYVTAPDASLSGQPHQAFLIS